MVQIMGGGGGGVPTGHATGFSASVDHKMSS